MDLLMEVLERKLELFGEVVGSKSKIRLEGKSRDNEDP
jgi:hypothetical protein